MKTRFSRKYAVALVSKSRILSIPLRHVSRREAMAYTRAYNRHPGRDFAVVMRHPIFRFAKADRFTVSAHP